MSRAMASFEDASIVWRFDLPAIAEPT